MIEVQRIELRELRLPLRTPFVTPVGVSEVRRVVLATLVDSTGITGWGESVALDGSSYSPETQDSAWATIRDVLAPAVLAAPWPSAAALDEALRSLAAGAPMARAAVETAAWSLEAGVRRVPLARLLGTPRSAVPAGMVIGFQPTEAALETAVGAAIAAGYRRVKLKVAPGRDLEAIAVARRIAGSEFDVAVDANGTYTLDDMETLRRMDGFGLSMIEQPLPAGDLAETARLQTSLETPICLDESIRSAADAALAVEMGACRIINVKPGRLGGHVEALAVRDLAVAAGVAVWCGGMLESGVGRAHVVALAASEGFTLTNDIGPSARYWERDVVDPPWVMKGGALAVPDGPGLGVAVDRERVEADAVRTERLEAS